MKYVLTAALILLSTTAQARVKSDESLGALHWGGVELGFILAYQSGGDSESATLAWTPSLAVSENVGLRANLGGTVFKAATASYFPVLDFEGYLQLGIGSSFRLELGGGGQAWLSDSPGMNPAAGTNIVLMTGGSVIEHVFVGYTAYFLPGVLTHEGRVGIGIAL